MGRPSVSIDATQVAAASMDGVGILDGTQIIEANETLAAIHGYETAGELVGQEWADLYTPADRDVTAYKLLTRVREEGKWRGRVFCHRHNGDGVPAEVSLQAADDGIVTVVRERPEATPTGRKPGHTDEQNHGRVHETLDSAGLETLLDTLDDVVYIVDEENDVVGWNHRLTERLGYTDEEVATMALPDFLPDEYGALLGEEGTRMVDFPDRIREMDIVSKDGERIPFELRGVTYTDAETGARYRVGIARDITERKARERELERYETIVETVDDGIYVLNEDFRVEMANERFFEMMAAFGFSREDVLEMHAHDLIVDDDERAALEAEIERAIDRESHIGTFEMSGELSDGEQVVCESRFRLYPEPDGEHRGCIGVLRDITDRKEQERQLTRQRDELDTLNRINELLLAVARDLFEAPMHGDIEQTVCSRLADSDLYQFAWIGTPQAGGTRLVPTTSAGVDEAGIDSVTTTADGDDPTQGPAGRAFRTGTIQVSHDIATDPTFEPWREVAVERDVRSAAAVPLVYDGTTYGVLAVYASRPLAFSRREQRGFEILGEAIGYAINARRTRQLLFTEQVVELQLRIGDATEFVIEATDRLDCQLSIEGTVAADEGAWLWYVAVSGPEADRFVDVAREATPVETVRMVDERADQPVVALTTGSALQATIASVGGRLTAGTVANGTGTFVVEVPQSTDISQFMDRLRVEYPEIRLAAKLREDRSSDLSPVPTEPVPSDLTDRQRQVLESAYRAGYFAWPRENSAEDVATLLNISRPTLLAHLRKAEQKLLSAIFADQSG